jgi:hypothetical protein
VQPDPSPEELYIYLHAIKYETDAWAFEDELPWWARPDWRSAREAGATASPEACGSSSSAIAPPVVYVANVAQRREAGGKLRVATGDANLPTLVQPRTAAHAAPGARQTSARKLLDVPEVDSHLPSLDVDDDADSTPAVLCEVFAGLEDVAQRDIEAQLRLFGVSTRTRAALHCAHVLVPAGRGAATAIRAFAAGRLPGVRAAYLVMQEAPMDAELLLRLATEKLELGNSKRAARLKALAEKKAQRAAKHAGKVVEEPSEPATPQHEEPDQLTAGEEELLAGIARHWHASLAARHAVFAAWRRVAAAMHVELTARTFRGSVERSAYLLPTLTTQMLERELGELAGQWLIKSPPIDEPMDAWRVDLKHCILDVTLKFIPSLGTPAGADASTGSHKSANNAPGSLFYLLALPAPAAGTVPSRPAIPTSLSAGGTSLARYRAYTLAAALPLPKLAGDERPRRLRILEPCVGRGSLAIELAAALQRRCSKDGALEADVYACDIDAAELARASQMLQLCHSPTSACEAVRLQLSAAPLNSTDVCAVQAFLGSSEPLDAILSDLPWGHRVGNSSNVARLYPRLVQSFCALLRPGGYALLMTAEQRTFVRILREAEGQARKTNQPYYLSIEALHLLDDDDDDDDEAEEDRLASPHAHEHAHAMCRQGAKEAERWQGLRPVEVGFGVYLFLLRKTAM